MTKKVIVGSLFIFTIILFGVTVYLASNKPIYKINLEDLTVTVDKKIDHIEIYEKDEFDEFYEDYQNNNLPNVYITKFLFDGVSMYKAYDLDDFIEKGDSYEPSVLEITNLNIHNIGKYELSGTIKDAMVSVNTNDLSGKVTLLLNNASIDTNSKKVPVIYVYNRNINYTKARVYINTIQGTKNYLSGGKFKKTSLIPSEDYYNYSSKYQNSDNYLTYRNYYSVYMEEEINHILFAKVEASSEDLQDGDPYYFYKGAGAISSDIDLYFDGEGYLEVSSKSKEGIETKGNLFLLGGKGDYVVNANDDCLNTTTKSSEKDARNTIYINVNSLYAKVSNDASEGDAIDSNGEIYIDGGKIIAIAKSGSDSGIDSEKGTYINGGEIIATGDMYDNVLEDSKQKVMVLSFTEKKEIGDTIVLENDDKPLMAYKTDCSFQILLYSSPKLDNKTYYLYQTTNINGQDENGLYLEINSYSKDYQLGYTNQMINMFDMPNQDMRMDNPPDMEKTNDLPQERGMDDFENRELPPDVPNEFNKPRRDPQEFNDFNILNNDSFELNKEFTINKNINTFGGIKRIES